ncbi:nuclear receptor subfamily 2 group E member 1 like protein, partial [Danaus plexippus plexippus]
MSITTKIFTLSRRGVARELTYGHSMCGHNSHIPIDSGLADELWCDKQVKIKSVQHERGPRKPKPHPSVLGSLPPPHAHTHKPHALKLSPPSPYTPIPQPFNFQ